MIHKISDQYVKACRRKVRKTVTDGWTDGRTDGDPDGHHHTIIRPVWRRAYKKMRSMYNVQKSKCSCLKYKVELPYVLFENKLTFTSLSCVWRIKPLFFHVYILFLQIKSCYTLNSTSVHILIQSALIHLCICRGSGLLHIFISVYQLYHFNFVIYQFNFVRVFHTVIIH